MAGVVHVNWYATLFRGDSFAAALEEITAVSLRYGASEYAVYRSRDDAYKVLQMTTWESHDDFDRYWYGEDFALWRADHQSWYQVPVLYVWHDLVVRGGLDPALTVGGPANGSR